MNEAIPADPTHDLEASGLVDGAIFKTALRNVTGCVSIVTAGSAPDRHGLTVTAASSLTADPSTVLVCVNKSAGAHETIIRTKCFGWNVLRADQVELAMKFAGMDGSKGETRFAPGDWMELMTGSPILIDALASFDCKVIGMHPVGTHTVFYGAVVGATHQDGHDGLVYRRGKFAVPREVASSR